MPNTDRVTISHPSMPGFRTVVSARSFESRRRRGWVIVNDSPAARADVPPSAEDDEPTSQEDTP